VAFRSFSFALVSCDRHDFLLGLARLHGPWGVAVRPSTDRGYLSLVEICGAPTQIGFWCWEGRALICESYFHLVFLSLYNPLEPLLILNFTRT